jgi:hypothetical protein
MVVELQALCFHPSQQKGEGREKAGFSPAFIPLVRI